MHHSVHVGKNVKIGRNFKCGRDVYIDDNTTIADNVSIAADSYIGSGCYIGDGVKINKEVSIGDDVSIGPGTAINSCGEICRNVKIGEGCRLEAGRSKYLSINKNVIIEPFVSLSVDTVWDYVRIGRNSKVRAENIYHQALIGERTNINVDTIEEGVRIHDFVNMDIPTKLVTYDVHISQDENDWILSIGPVGSRGDTLHARWSVKRKRLLWYTGCQRGISTKNLISRVEKCHLMSPTNHYRDYMTAIEFVLSHDGLEKARNKTYSSKK